MSGHIACPTCGQSPTEKMIVGKSQIRSKGEISTYPVIVCSCGQIYKGEKKESKKMTPRPPTN